ncbi:MAG: T9SS type A sorting domain-containing protein [Ignavibacteria bacterium]|nr:T9SS type A sorting domain-containing protein [Ignavibacteria bacterium]
MKFSLFICNSNYPNPFGKTIPSRNPTTTINYQLPEDGHVTIKVYDLLGREVATLVNENKQAGYHKIDFDASRLTSGIYIYTINANNFAQSKKMILTINNIVPKLFVKERSLTAI